MRASSLIVAGLAVTIILIAPASSAPIARDGGKKIVLLTEKRLPEIRARWFGATTYLDCMSVVRELGWSDWEGWYGCNARKFKN
jgi:hypothetical protein